MSQYIDDRKCKCSECSEFVPRWAKSMRWTQVTGWFCNEGAARFIWDVDWIYVFRCASCFKGKSSYMNNWCLARDHQTLHWSSWHTIYGGSPAILTYIFCVFPQSLQANVCVVLKLGYDWFLPHPFQFIIHWSSYHSALWNLSYW
jgi:hypothetical protein